MIKSSDFEKATEIIKNSNCAIITSHIRPDGDACGSMMAVCRVLNSLGKQAYPFLLSPLAQWYNFLFDDKAPILGNDITTEKLQDQFGEKADLIIIVDTNSRVQLPAFAEFLEAFRKDKQVLVIDHHITNDGLGDFELVDSTAAATGVIVHELIKYAGWEITKDVAEALFVAISTDTGWFRFSNSDSRLFRDAADLLDTGISPPDIYRKMYQNFSPERMKLLSLVLSRIQLHFDNKLATQYILRKDFDDTKTTGTDTENLIDECQRISSVDAAAMFVELKDGGFRCSLRSKGKVDVRQIAQKFGGGGHKMASGVNLQGPLETAMKNIIESVKEQLY